MKKLIIIITLMLIVGTVYSQVVIRPVRPLTVGELTADSITVGNITITGTVTGGTFTPTSISSTYLEVDTAVIDTANINLAVIDTLFGNHLIGHKTALDLQLGVGTTLFEENDLFIQVDTFQIRRGTGLYRILSTGFEPYYGGLNLGGSSANGRWDTILGTVLNVPKIESYIEFTAVPESDHTIKGVAVTKTNGNGSSVNFGDVCYIASDGDMEFANADTVSTMPGMFMAAETIAAGASGLWLDWGRARDDSWSWDQGEILYISISGTTGNTLIDTVPTAARDQVQIIGIAADTNIVEFKPNLGMLEIQ